MDRSSVMALDLIHDIIKNIGDEPNREGLLDTPKRVVKSWNEIYKGYSQNPKDILGTTFEGEGYQQMVVLKDIEMYSTCEHHMQPFFGKAHVAYIPKNRVVGLSKLARLVECFSRRLQIQERLTKQIAEAIQEHLDPIGVGVVLEAKHFCMMARGVGKQNSSMITSELLGAMRDHAVREEFLRLLK
jgi:GTP cyclohydrolase I